MSIVVRIVACALFLASAGDAFAQTPEASPEPQEPTLSADGLLPYPRWEATLGYQFLQAPDQSFPVGVNIDGAWNLSEPFGVVGEIGWAVDSEDEDRMGATLHAWNIGVGPRWTVRNAQSVWPYVQVLAGALHARASGALAGEQSDDSATRFMLQPGVGVGIVAGDGWGIVGSADYRRVFLDEDEDGEPGENQFRVFVGFRLILD